MDEAAGLGGLDAAADIRRRVQVVYGDAEIGVIEDVEKLRAELEILVFSETEVFHGGEVPLLVAGPLNDVAAGVAKLADLGAGIEFLERGWVVPAIWGAGVGAVGASAFGGIADEVGTITGETGNFRRAALRGDSRGIVNREGRAGLEGGDAVDLPATEDDSLPSLRIAEERQFPLIAENETMARVEHGAAVFGAEVERILREVVFAGGALRGGTGDVEGGNVVESFGERVRAEHGEAM